MRFDPALLMEEHRAPTPGAVVPGDGLRDGACDRLAGGQLAAELYALEESAPSSWASRRSGLVEGTLDGYHGGFWQASSYHPNRCSVL